MKKGKAVKGEGIPKKAETQPTTKPKVANNELAQKMLGILATLKANGVVEATSTVIRDKLGLDNETGRDTVRRIMRKLADEGKVVIGEKEHGKRKQYFFSLPTET